MLRLETPAECRYAEPHAAAYVRIEAKLHWTMIRLLAGRDRVPCSDEGLEMFVSTLSSTIGQVLPIEFNVEVRSLDEKARSCVISVSRADGLPLWDS